MTPQRCARKPRFQIPHRRLDCRERHAIAANRRKRDARISGVFNSMLS
jgi:hypothetical protein